jgi:anti-sigma regulatory factor (Ser/Thr protein kinase)
MATVQTSRPREQAEFAHFQWPADEHQLAQIRATARGWLSSPLLTEDAAEDMLVAVSEAASNAIEHAYPAGGADQIVEVTFWRERRSVCFEIVDHGRWKKPGTQPSYRGRGIAMMERLVDWVLIHYDARGTRVLLGLHLTDVTRDLPGGFQRPASLVRGSPRPHIAPEREPEAGQTPVVP